MPNLLATIEAVVDQRLAEASLISGPMPTVGPSLTALDVESMVLIAILQRLVTEPIFDTTKTTVDAKYRGNGEWLAEVSVTLGGQSGALGQWRVIEITGDIIPYDASARGWSNCMGQ